MSFAVAVVYSRSKTEAEAVVAEVGLVGGRALALKADVAVDAECNTMVEQVVAEFGGVEVNCAGATAFIPFDNLEAVTEDLWDRLFHVNVLGAFHCSRAVWKAMLESGGRSSMFTRVPAKPTSRRRLSGDSGGPSGDSP